jgi:hypothetical protein
VVQGYLFHFHGEGPAQLTARTRYDWSLQWGLVFSEMLDVAQRLEARVGIEPTHKGFADLSLTAWVPRHLYNCTARPDKTCSGKCDFQHMSAQFERQSRVFCAALWRNHFFLDSFGIRGASPYRQLALMWLPGAGDGT